MNAIHLPLRIELFGIWNPGGSLDSLQSCQNSILPWEKTLHIPTPRDSRATQEAVSAKAAAA